MIDKIIIRNDINFIYKDLSIIKKKEIINALKNIFYKYYDCEIEIIEHFKNIKTTKPTLSLDCWYSGDFSFRVSRVFRVFTEQIKPDFLIYSEIPKNIPNEEILIIDDDYSTGFTLKRVIDILNIKQYEYQTLIPRYNCKYDVIDIRDFIFGSEYGGLYTQYGRIPYIYPFVNLKNRASIVKQEKFSKEIFELNMDIFKEHPLKYIPLNYIEQECSLEKIYKKYYK